MAETGQRLRHAADWVEAFADPRTFAAMGTSHADGGFGGEVIAGFGEVHGRPVAIYAHDSRCESGYVTGAGARKIARLMNRALELGVPVCALAGSLGVSLREGIQGGDEYTAVINANVRLSGQVPQLTAVVSVTLGAPAYSAVLTDLTVFNATRSHLLLSGPAVVESMLGERATFGELGGAAVHRHKTGLAHFVEATVEAQLAKLRWLAGFLPSHCREDPPRRPPAPPARALPPVPARENEPFDMGAFVDGLVDQPGAVAYAPDYGPEIITAFAHLGGHAVGVLANQSAAGTGAIAPDGAAKAARFLRLCGAYNVPLLNLIDVPGYLPGVEAESAGILRQGAQMIRGFLTRTPKLSVVVRRCYGAAAFVMMQTANAGGDLVLALPGARIALMGGASTAAANAEGAADAAQAAPAHALRCGIIDAIVPADELRQALIRHLDLLARKRDLPLLNDRGIWP